MNEVDKPRKPLIYYYGVVLLLLMLFNLFLMPALSQQAIKEVDYGTFMAMTESGEVGSVQIQANQILFTDKTETTVYKTGLMEDPRPSRPSCSAGCCPW